MTRRLLAVAACLIVAAGVIARASRVLFIHTGGLPGNFILAGS